MTIIPWKHRKVGLTFILGGMLCLASGIFSSSHAQHKFSSWGKVSSSEMELNEVPFDQASDIIILGETGKISFTGGASAFITYRTRMKIVNKRGLEKASISITFYGYKGFESVYNVKGLTWNKENGKIIKTKLEKKDVFVSDINQYWKKAAFTFPNVKVGSVIEYQYTKKTNDVRNLDEWKFQHEYPTLFSSVEVVIGSGLTYRPVYNGHKLIEMYKNKSTNHWELYDLPALRREPFVYNVDSYANKIVFQLEEYYHLNMAGGTEHVRTMTDWSQLAKDVLASAGYQSYHNNHTIAKEHLAAMGLDKKPELREIFDYVHDLISWDDTYGIYPDRSLKKVIESGSGSSDEINLLLMLLLKEAGYNASAMLVSTHSHGMIMRSYPLLKQFNSVMVYVISNQREYFMDATQPYLPYNITSSAVLDTQGFVLDKENPRWVKIKPGMASGKNVRTTIRFDSLNRSHYHTILTFKGQEAVQARNLYHSNKIDFIKNYVPQDYEVSNDSVSNFEKLHLPFMVVLEYTKTLPTNSNLMIFLEPIPSALVMANPFKQDHRVYDIEYGYTFEENFSVAIILPTGQKTVELPEEQTAKITNSIANFHYIAHQVSPRRIQVESHFSMSRSIIPSAYYEQLKDLFSEVWSSNKQMVVIGSSK